MGLTFHDAYRLIEARDTGVSFENTLSFARLKLFLHPSELRALRQRARPGALEDYTFGEYSDRFWREILGVTNLTTLDYSDYEGAEILHDMNLPIPEGLHSRFDAVVDAGSLEHIFNFPTAIRNLMLMTRTGGTLFLTTPANSLCGHGFYQFSPELMYRIFSEENGFEQPRVMFLEAMYPAVELRPIRAVYRVVDPAEAGDRVVLQSGEAVIMMVDAKKVRHVTPFERVPQQSDYVVAWKGEAGTERSGLRKVFDALPSWCQREIRGLRQKRQASLANARFYRRLA
jgi:hypothetical protein